ncbi:NADP(H)-dependent aldo-keto reductase [Galbibacter sp. EGI 63066]|uniref:NADP(H)-dependent aldo-keto reductase n=1 Tax=Galbibacter sp. EGI 63066 TaxID=2993559 RepID=UPI002248ACF9|nr:NADP(H)-dependent aldo-keto reductase [Galbibacter sp. EGI 63066]MCX2680533.1 NADP(H)-dependent aldo-keto reductase [Galbibacter sp. EGI 63066]
MKYTKLPKTDVEISKICLGTMTWGKQNTEAEGHEQMDHAVDQGINFFDTAELYAIPIEKETQGTTETIIGNWFKKTGKRDEIVLASKVAGPSNRNRHSIRDDERFNKKMIDDALHNSLKRLQTDYIDLYQLHWPDRNSNFFGKRDYTHITDDAWEDNINEILQILEGYIKEGKIRYIGLSNDVPWSTMRYLEESKYFDLPRIRTVQNPYNLLNRTYEIGLAEISMKEEVGLLPYSPLAFGRLTDKYIDKKGIENARLTLFPQFARYNGENALKATKMYYDLAKENGLSLATLALAFINQQPFVSSNIIGATSMEQLKENIDSINVELSPELLMEINKIHELIPNPAP